MITYKQSSRRVKIKQIIIKKNREKVVQDKRNIMNKSKRAWSARGQRITCKTVKVDDTERK